MDDNKIYESRSLEGSIEMSGKRDKIKIRIIVKLTKLKIKIKNIYQKQNLSKY